MFINEVRWQAYRLPMRQFTTAHEALNWRTGAILEIIFSNGISGLGEIAPLPAFGVGTLDDAAKVIQNLAPTLHGLTIPAALEHLKAQANYQTSSLPALCGLEIALLDALGIIQQKSLSALLCPPGSQARARVEINAVIGEAGTEAATKAARAATTTGIRCIKLKVGVAATSQQEISRIAAVRAAIGPDVQLRLDANESWEPEQARTILNGCERYSIQYIEQPLKAERLTELRRLRQQIAIPLAADEGLLGLESARNILHSQATDLLIIKPQFAGGLLTARQIIKEATEQGVGCVITSAIEAGIGLAANLQLAAASPEVTLACGLGTLPLLVDDLLLEELAVHHGYLAVPTGPGLGVMLDREALSRYRLT